MSELMFKIESILLNYFLFCVVNKFYLFIYQLTTEVLGKSTDAVLSLTKRQNTNVSPMLYKPEAFVRWAA